MKINKKPQSAEENFKSDLSDSMSKYYRQNLSENIKRGIRLKEMRNFELKFGLDRHEPLPKDFVERVVEYKSKIKEVETTTLEQTLDNFRRDIYPNKELLIWESIAEYYDVEIKKNSKMDIAEKKNLFTEALVWTLG